MAEHKREDWEIDRDRAEIAALLSRYRTITHAKIAKILNERRVDEYKEAIADLGALSADEGIPNLPNVYTLSRQMIDYDVRAIRKEWKKTYRQKFDEHASAELAAAFELHTAAWEGYERSMRPTQSVDKQEESVDLKTTRGHLMGVLGEPIYPDDAGKPVTLPGAVKSKLRRKKTETYGDPKFLMVVDRAQERIDKLLGLAEAQEINVNTPGAADIVLVAGFDPEKWKPKPEPEGKEGAEDADGSNEETN